SASGVAAMVKPLVQPSTPKPAGRPVRQSASMQAALLTKKVQPVYPSLARQSHISGTVKMHAIIGKDGTVRVLDVLSGHPLLTKAAVDAVKQWLYKPTVLNGHGVEVDTTIDVLFSLTGGAPATDTNSNVAPAAPAPAKSPCTFGKIEFSEQGNRLVGTVPYTYQGTDPLNEVALRGVPLTKDKQQIPGLTYQQTTLKTASG